MTELKFKAYNEKYGMSEPFSLFEEIEFHNPKDGGMSAIFKPEESLKQGFKIIQFIGKQDADNKDIYEGYIVEFGLYPQKRYIVFWNEEILEYCINTPNIIGEYTDYDYYQISDSKKIYKNSFNVCINPFELKIIGNIYEHPELIQQVIQ